MYRASPFGLMVVRFPLDFFVGITPEYRPGMRLQMWPTLDAAFRTQRRAVQGQPQSFSGASRAKIVFFCALNGNDKVIEPHQQASGLDAVDTTTYFRRCDGKRTNVA
jgi:hypothetical protein